MSKKSYYKDVILHDGDAFKAMRKAGKLAAEVLDFITPYVVPGASTGGLDKLCHDFIIANNATPAPLNYKGFPKSTCISVNHVICHGIPAKDKILREGDIANIDVTVILHGWYGDTSRMYLVGDKIPVKAKKLVAVTHECLMAAIAVVRPGAFLGDVGAAIEQIAHQHHYGVVEDFCGHGIGQTFHAPPSVLHYGQIGTGLELRQGMIFTIEPMINIGTPKARILDDGWTAVTRDRSLSAQFEHTIGVTDEGAEIFTLSPKDWHQPPYQ